MLNTTMLAFLHKDDGAVTVDWVVVTAAIAGLALSVLLAIDDAVYTTRDTIGTRTVAAAEHDWSFTISLGEEEASE